MRACEVEDPSYTAMGSELYKSYEGWCRDNGHSPMTSTRLGRELEERGYAKRRVESGVKRQGIRVVTDDAAGARYER